ncbi:TPA: hypothetical protein STX83_002489 [Clostridioides difficile]|uniref:hypothetical protein n=1 Tax=Clostridioides difficile TaxID=1496 RepID=UPI000943D4D0|nr:hypothetical protein [Clostridioides difficile]EGT4066960.1 hypothetical protein [Clostridioides difficile]MCJ0090216.1 hypothetical protein [Clostridioides difficile]MCU5894742.1 hypothetical protein [Clostridioides difficile]MCU5995995.1 hypothetical protein [Clostridioides difficile]MCU6011004.1 hypothetical protein [Clostridioides difficile]
MNDLRGKIIKELDEFNIDADDEFLDYGVEYVESFTGKSAISEELLIRGVVFMANYIVNMENKNLD